MSEEDQRGYFRVAARMGLSVRVLTDADWDAALESIERNESAAERIEPELARVLDRLEQKVDLVLEHLGVSNPERIQHPELRDILLSGSGIRFESAAPLALGDRVLVEIELSAVPPDRIRALGSVVGAEPAETAVRFDVIREEDRDRIVQQTLAIERQRLRGKRRNTG